MNRSRVLGSMPIVAGVLLLTAIIFKSDNPTASFTLGLFASSCFGYVLCFVALLCFRSAMPAVLGACFAMSADALLFNEVFLHPRGSMSGMGLLGVPIVNAVLSVLGIAIGWIAMALARRSVARKPNT